mmetsp:Transcript_18021/g.36964  ORF Transcript_18021/g.36964 Transcript_18021/m.36964 type:complete len:231 (+) Transcript_18021:1036-1728(+)
MVGLRGDFRRIDVVGGRSLRGSIDHVHNASHLGHQGQPTTQQVPGFLLDQNQVVAAERNDVARQRVFDVGRVVLCIRRYQLRRGFDLERSQTREKMRKVLGLRERQEIKIEAVPGGIDLQDRVAQVSVRRPAQGHFEGGQSFPVRTVLALLAQLNEGLPRAVGVLSVAVVAHLPLDLKDDRNPLLDRHLVEVGPDGQANLETHAVRFRPDPGTVHDVDFVVALGRVALLV